jgi:hypothetical protein
MKPIKAAKYKVTVAINVPAYAEVEIEAKSPADAERIARKDIKENGWDTNFWCFDKPQWQAEWEEADDLHVVEGSAEPKPPPVSKPPLSRDDVIGDPE